MVIKIGGSVLMTKRNKLDEFRINHIAKQLAVLKNEDLGFVLVISGAVACGSNIINLSADKSRLRRAAAGIGQIHVTSTFNSIFIQSQLQLAQLLLTRHSLGSRDRRSKIASLIKFYIRRNIIPLINENDVIDLNSLGGNDLLAAEITDMVHAKKLLILSTWQGSMYGIGGGLTKQEAVAMLTKRQIETKIVNGKIKNILLQTFL